MFFPNITLEFECISLTKNNLVLKLYLDNFICISLYFFSMGGSQISKFSLFQNFPKLGLREGDFLSRYVPQDVKFKLSTSLVGL